VRFEDHGSVERALCVTGGTGPLNPRRRPHGRLQLDKTLRVSRVWMDDRDADANASTEASVADGLKDETAEADNHEKKHVHIKESGISGVLTELTQALKLALDANGSPGTAAFDSQFLAMARQKLSTQLDAAKEHERTLSNDLARLRSDALAKYNEDAPEGWLIPIAGWMESAELDGVSEASLHTLPPLAPPAEPPHTEQAFLVSQRRPGFIKCLRRDQGFGFIASSTDTVNFFFHTKDCEFSMETAKVGDQVSFFSKADCQGRPGSYPAVSVRLLSMDLQCLH